MWRVVRYTGLKFEYKVGFLPKLCKPMFENAIVSKLFEISERCKWNILGIDINLQWNQQL